MVTHILSTGFLARPVTKKNSPEDLKGLINDKVFYFYSGTW